MDNSIYRWVKASEKMIDVYSIVPAKRGNILGQLQREDERFVQFIWKGGVDSYTIKSENLGSIEWLSPIEADQQEKILADVEELLKYNCEGEIDRVINTLRKSYHLIPK